jgi:heat shock protein HtpX
MAAYGLYTHIQSNKRRSIALLVGLFFLVYLLVYAGALLGEALTIDAPPDELLRRALYDALYAAPWATLGTALWIFIAYKFHQSMIDAVTGGREVTRQQEPRLYNLLENLCISRGITTPKLKVIEDDNLNAFATGMNEKQYSITVTTGLLNSLDDAEIESVLGHELTHIRNGDVRLLVIAVIIAGVIAFFAELVFRLMFQGGLRWRGRDSGDRRGGAGLVILIAFVLIAIAWMLSIVIRFSLSRKREYLADAGSVELTKNPDAMISALRKIEGRGELPGATSAVMEMCIDNPREGFSNVFDTHPPIDARVAALVKFAGGHDPGRLALPARDETDASGENEDGDQPAGRGPWEQETRDTSGGEPFLPVRPPIELGSPPAAESERGPWGPHRKWPAVENEARLPQPCCGIVRNDCWEVSAPGGPAFAPPAAPLPSPKPAIACTS